MSRYKKEIFGNTKSCYGVDISDTTSFFSSEEQNKMSNNPGVLKMIQDFPKRKKQSEYYKGSKSGNMNGACNTSNTNTNITQAVQ